MNAAEQSRYLTAMGIPVWRPKAEMVLPAAFATDNEPIRTHTPQPESLHIAAMAEERVTPIPPKT
ncbi:MAG: hypothetical protein WBC34_12945, partial [Thiofilum sp.]